MIKERQITVLQFYKVCDYCGEEIRDHSLTLMEKKGFPSKHFHSMPSGGEKGTVEHTCLELFYWKYNFMNELFSSELICKAV